jgi:hypothetical protein
MSGLQYEEQHMRKRRPDLARLFYLQLGRSVSENEHYWNLFYRLCPKWYGRIMKYGFHGAFTRFHWQMEDRWTCIVGELHGWHGKYEMKRSSDVCDTCDRFGDEVLLEYDGYNWADEIPKLMRHWENRHM